MNLKVIVSEIEARTPIRVNTCKRIMSGWEYDVMDINGKHIVRIPRYKETWGRLEKELLVLSLLTKRLSVSVPNYEFIWRGDRRHILKFAAYRKIPGIACTRDNFRIRWTSNLGKDLGRFLTELHRIRPSAQVRNHIQKYTVRTWAENQSKFYDEVRKYAYPLLHQAVRDRANEFWTRFLSTFEETEFEPPLIHSD